MKKKINQARQGDVLLIKVDSIPGNLNQTKKNILALGEVTGHYHSAPSAGVLGFADPDDKDGLAEFLDVAVEEAPVTHQEHGTITLDKGKYRSVIQSEYSPEAIRRVAD